LRTALFLLVGLLLLAACLLLGRLFATHYPGAVNALMSAYLVLWLAVAGFNLWVGVTRAGYTVREELPIFLVIFAVPVIAALALRVTGVMSR
jgi:hypothetical protein